MASATAIDSVPPSPYSSVHNFRDVGETINKLTGQSLVRTGVLYRSAQPDRASPTDRIGIVQTNRIQTVIDLRSTTEHIEAAKKLPCWSQEDAPDVPYPQLKAISLTGKAFEMALAWKLSWWDLGRLLFLLATGQRLAGIRVMAEQVMAPRGLLGLGIDTLTSSTAEIKEIFHVLADKSSYPLLVHCTQGKDRTGITIILALLLLPVPISAISADYCASERELQPELEERLETLSGIGLGPEFAKCSPVFVDRMLEYIDSFGGVEGYLEHTGVNKETRSKVRENLGP